MNIPELMIRLAEDNTATITKEELYQIPMHLHCHDDELIGKTCKELSNDDTTPGANLLWEFNANICDLLILDNTQQMGELMRKFVDLLKRLDISTEYDCFDSYGSQDEDPEVAIIDQLCFEADPHFVQEIVMPLAIAGNFFTEEKFKECYPHFFETDESPSD